MRFGLIGQSFTPYSINAASQRTANFYPERVEVPDGKDAYTLYGTPGLANLLTIMQVAIVAGGTGYTANDILTVVSGTGTAATLIVNTVAAGVITSISVNTSGFYSVFPTDPVSVTGGTGTGATATLTFGAKTKAIFFEPRTSRIFTVVRMEDNTSRLFEITLAGGQTDRGQIKAATAGSNPVSISSNGLQLFILEGAESYFAAFTFTLATNVLADITASVGNGEPIWGQFLDQYFVALCSDGKTYVSALLDGGTWDVLDVAEAESSPDYTKMIHADHGEIWQFGTESIEVWWNSGDLDYPFAVNRSATMQSGLSHQFSVAPVGTGLMWVGRMKNGPEVVYRSDGYRPVRVSNYAVEQSIQQKTVAGVAPTAFSYQQFGHSFYVLTYPDDNLTWVYDATENMWHERTYLNGSTEEAHRARCHCFAGPINAASSNHLVGDRANGRIYTLRMDNLSDFGNTIRRIRRCPHTFNRGEWIYPDSLEIFGEFGLAAQQRLNLRLSKDGGKTFTGYRTVDVGTAGGRSSGATAVAISNDGTAYVADDLLTVVGGTGTAATIRVNTVSGTGDILTSTLETPGSYTVNPTNPASVTGGVGNGATFNLTIESQYYRNRARWRRGGRYRDGVYELMVEDSVKWVLSDADLQLAQEEG